MEYNISDELEKDNVAYERKQILKAVLKEEARKKKVAKSRAFAEKFYSEFPNSTILRDYRALAGFSSGLIHQSTDLEGIYEYLKFKVSQMNAEELTKKVIE